MKITGACHCQRIRVELTWPATAGPMPAKRCGCSYCMRFDGTWTSHPEAELVLQVAGDAREQRYRFGTGTADFLFCGHCGVVLAALDDNAGNTRAVVNINTLDLSQEISFSNSDSDFEGESLQARLDRRAANWISSVTFLREAEET